MARSGAFNVSFDTSALAALAARLGEVTPEIMGAALVNALNETADSTYTLSRKTILSGINLTDAYVSRQMRVEHADAKTPTASIIAMGGRGHTTGLSHYGAMQETKKVTWSNERIRASGHKLGRTWPGWVARRGDTARGIAIGEKSAGVSVQVTTARKTLKTGKAFIMPGKTDSDGAAMVFKRGANNKLRALQGPSVYQLFRVAGALIENQVYGNLTAAIADAAEQQILRDLS